MQFLLNTLINLHPKLIFPAFKIGIFFENFLIIFSSFFVKPVVPITTFFFCFTAIFKISNVHLGTVKSIITLAFLKASKEFNFRFNSRNFFIYFFYFQLKKQF